MIVNTKKQDKVYQFMYRARGWNDWYSRWCQVEKNKSIKEETKNDEKQKGTS